MSKSKFADIAGRKSAAAPDAEATPAPAVGRPPNPQSLRQQLERGEAKQLKLIVPAELHKRLKIRAAVEERDISDIAAEVLGDYLDSTEG